MNALVSRLMSVFGAPERTENVEAFLAEYDRITARFGPNVQHRAADHLISNGGRHWPTPKACKEACTDAQESIALSESSKPKPKVKMPWEIHDEQARQWAVDFCKHTALGKRAFGEGWGRPLFTEAKSWAREKYRTGQMPNREQFSVSDEWIAYHVKHSVPPNSWFWMDRVEMLGEELFGAIADNRRQFGEPPARGAGSGTAKLFRAPLPPVASEDQFTIDEQTGAT